MILDKLWIVLLYPKFSTVINMVIHNRSKNFATYRILHVAKVEKKYESAKCIYYRSR